MERARFDELTRQHEATREAEARYAAKCKGLRGRVHTLQAQLRGEVPVDTHDLALSSNGRCVCVCVFHVCAHAATWSCSSLCVLLLTSKRTVVVVCVCARAALRCTLTQAPLRHWVYLPCGPVRRPTPLISPSPHCHLKSVAPKPHTLPWGHAG